MTDAMQRLPGRDIDPRLLAAIQLASLRFLLGPVNSGVGQVTHTDEPADRGQAAGGAIGFSISRDERARDTRLGEVENDGCAANKNRKGQVA